MENYLAALLCGPIPRELSFPREEYERRVTRTRTAMEAQGIDALLVHGAVDLCYLTGYQTLWPDAYSCLVLPLEDDPVMQVATVEASCAVLHSEIKDLVLYDWVGSDVAPRQLANLLEERGFGASRIGIQAGRIEMGNRGPVDARLARQLEAALPDATFIDATFLMFDLRVMKSDLEIAHLREAARITSLGMKAAIEAVTPGATENDIAAVAAQTMIENGSEFFSIDPIVNAGHRTGYFHTTFKRAPIEKPGVVQIELGACFHRYTAPQMRTVFLGEPDNMARRMIEANIATLELACENIRAGRTSHEVAVAIREGVRQLDDDIFRSGHFGYSIGLGFPPTWTDGPMYITEGSERVLEAGMTFHTPYSWRIPKKFVVGTSETIVVTADGCEVLTDTPREVTIKD